ncbi:MAG: twin-arginine translocase subunit TatC [Dehalogenimonas sp.]|jgi:sec-independent protein translocase protein TatC|uniref:Sec-independent protein translocase protein TatC n=1 Tax=Candidatus Dehalogenimonas loeffleri TaxID=3127115 RepID=A0ABZ2J547_9CHLR|nr:twin-arginine translocase subunit TatC [Dehalogenimonas sp.]
MTTAEEHRLPITQHFTEMRQRFIRSLAGIGVGTAIAIFFGFDIIEVLKGPAGDLAGQLVAIEMLEMISLYFRVSLTAGFILAMPWVLYQFFAFLMPAFTQKEKRFIFTFFPFIVIMFLSGVAFAYWVAMPPAVQFLFGFGAETIEVMPRVSNYIDVVLRLLVGIGLAFELPIILTALSAVGIVTSKWLASKRKIWLVMAFVLAAFITPTMDPINQAIVAGPLIVLYELSIWLTKIVKKGKKAKS